MQRRFERRNRLLRQFGLTEAEYAERLVAQDGLCAICHRPETATTKSGAVRMLSIDHDHRTGRLRGLLCRACNLLIGYAADDAGTLRSAIAYLARG